MSDRDKYRSREWDEQDRALLAAHVADPRDETTPDWRSRFSRALSERKCLHTQRVLIETETPYGIWGHEICADCGEHVRRECAHVRLTWHHDGQALICDNCGRDGT